VTAEQPYQLMPQLTAEEYAALRDDITENGVLVPVVKDQYGNILDGHHRVQVAEDLGITYRVDVAEVRDEEHARSLARRYNLARRHLSREQKRQLIAAEITANPDDSDRAIGRRLCCDHKTVGSVRRELSGEIPHPSLTAAQRRKADMLLQIMKGRTVDACRRIRNDEPILAFDVGNALEMEDLEVVRDVWPRFTDWASSSDETRGVLWEWAE
jgi:hypothetical protein